MLKPFASITPIISFEYYTVLRINLLLIFVWAFWSNALP